MKELYKLKFGERYSSNSNSSWIRVPGGWIYGDMQGTCFVPFDNEYQNGEDFDNTQQLKAAIAKLENERGSCEDAESLDLLIDNVLEIAKQQAV